MEEPLGRARPASPSALHSGFYVGLQLVAEAPVPCREFKQAFHRSAGVLPSSGMIAAFTERQPPQGSEECGASALQNFSAG